MEPGENKAPLPSTETGICEDRSLKISEHQQQDNTIEEKEGIIVARRQDAFGNEEHAEVKYKVLSWW